MHLNISTKTLTYLFADKESDSLSVSVETLAFLIFWLPEQVKYAFDLTLRNTDTVVFNTNP